MILPSMPATLLALGQRAMVPHPEFPPDHLRDPLQGPALGRESRGDGPLMEDLQEVLPLLLAELGGASRVWPSPQTSDPLLLQELLPPRHSSTAHPHASGDLGLGKTARPQEPSRCHTPFL
jgi:hypothetical protein